ncbi:MAG: FAD-binding oxidoreductase [Gammaproteobacteria bacterium]
MSYTIQLESSSLSFLANADEWILTAAQRQGIHLPYGCQNGVCSNCICDLISGSFEYPEGEPKALAAPGDANNPVVICKAVATADLVLKPRETLSEAAPELKTMPCRVKKIERLSSDVMLVQLTIPQHEPFQFRAGQYIEFILKDGRRRAFSLANAAHETDNIELHIRYIDGGSFTGHVFEEMQAREMMRIEGPLGSFFLRENSSRPVILVGGGTGFAPLKGMLSHAFHQQMDRQFHLFWGAANEEGLYMDELPRQWEKDHNNFTYTPVVENDSQWFGNTGLVTDAVIAAYPDLIEFDIYMSGAPAMVASATHLFVEQGAVAEQMFSDAFEFASDILSKKRKI